MPWLFVVLFAYVTFWRPKKVVDQLEDKISLATFWCLFGILLEDKKSCMTFCRPFFSFGRQKVTKRTTKSRTIFLVSPIWSATKKRQQKVAEVILDGKKSPWGKGRQKVAALVFTCSNKMFTCTLHIVIALKSKHLHFLHLDVWAPPLNSRLAFLSEIQTLCFSPLHVFCSCASSPDPSMFLGLGQSHPLSTVHQEQLLSLESQGQGKPVVDRV